MIASKTDCLLRKFGHKKVYNVERKVALGDVYAFDKCFIEALDSYLLSEPIIQTKSQYKNIILFIELADDKMVITDEKFKSFTELDKYLGKIGLENG